MEKAQEIYPAEITTPPHLITKINDTYHGALEPFSAGFLTSEAAKCRKLVTDSQDKL